MAAPVVQSLEQILAEIDPSYAPTETLYNQQIAGIPQKYQAQRQGMEVAKTNAFRDINRGANARGMAFSGMPMEEQTRYVGEKYLPGLTALEQQGNSETLELQKALAGLQGEKRNRALDTRNSQQTAYTQWEQAEQARQAEEARWWANFNEEKRQFEAQMAFNRSQSAARSASSAQADPRSAAISAMDAWFKQNGGQGNKNITRKQQDAFVESWLNANGIKGTANRQIIWDAINAQYKRAANWWEDWRR